MAPAGRGLNGLRSPILRPDTHRSPTAARKRLALDGPAPWLIVGNGLRSEARATCCEIGQVLGVDRAADEADRAPGRRLSCPVLVLWSSRDDLPRLYGDPLAIWRGWADDVHVDTIDSGHHMAEEAPAELAHRLMVFFDGG